jgi:hypothetical protein
VIRRLRVKSLVAILTLLVPAAIGSSCASSPVAPSQVPLGRPFDLSPGGSATVEGGLKVTFVGVSSDSRCPTDVRCVWAGDALVTLSLAQSPADPAERELHTNAAGSTASYRAYTVVLGALAPHPRSDLQIRPDDYVATLTVEAR